eukprot:TRINITY_DN10818_c0_g1_i1.p2 TRINITY_DN10818_c0_g1~~TRINITY_DN10818_c0_g1_i1.p2  ORF type:complete len:113 (-),score=32.39 TRINITY_DN10818_c0_g1_i1:22-360(-)
MPVASENTVETKEEKEQEEKEEKEEIENEADGHTIETEDDSETQAPGPEYERCPNCRKWIIDRAIRQHTKRCQQKPQEPLKTNGTSDPASTTTPISTTSTTCLLYTSDAADE